MVATQNLPGGADLLGRATQAMAGVDTAHFSLRTEATCPGALRGRLDRAVGPEETEGLAAPDLDAPHGQHRAEALDKTPGPTWPHTRR